ncbi:hypothetical protein [Pseudomarimonas salicorniae]|uniref:DUF2971 domain-containing protein n=1 Tax=Pseudomarimonas salicorniae TaxID=2933270 RepID=A0ABT0GCL0_9GAMM|nr:hypothetical protein [Lysobacter sp. CAU 1642]MCK7592183.1 hypothetical protein [Lysobacter sp. CAU 1642]
MSLKDRQPLLMRRVDEPEWRRCGRRVFLDAAADELAGRQVYRYASLAETLLWLRQGRSGFARPATWPDRYERFVAERLWTPEGPLARVGAWLKCLSFEFGSEALWRTYAGHGGVLRIGLRLRDLVAELNRLALPRGARVMVGRCRYLDERDLHRALERLSARLQAGEDPLPVAMQALLLKRSGFAWENELRIAVLCPDSEDPPTVMPVEGLRPDRLQSVEIDPYLPAWQAAEWQAALASLGDWPGRIRQSGFDAEPAAARR